MPKSVSYTNLRANLRKFLNRVCDNREPLYVTRRNGSNVVIVSEDDFESMDETAYLLNSPANKKHLEESLGNVKRKEIVKLDMKEFEKCIKEKCR